MINTLLLLTTLASVNVDTIHVWWDANTEPDLHSYQIFHNHSDSTIVYTTIDTFLYVLQPPAGNHSFWVYAKDETGNLSNASEIVSVVVPGPITPVNGKPVRPNIFVMDDTVYVDSVFVMEMQQHLTFESGEYMMADSSLEFNFYIDDSPVWGSGEQTSFTLTHPYNDTTFAVQLLVDRLYMINCLSVKSGMVSEPAWKEEFYFSSALNDSLPTFPSLVDSVGGDYIGDRPEWLRRTLYIKVGKGDD